MILNPLVLPPEPFLWLYVLLLGASWLLSHYAGHRLRPDGVRRTVSDPDSLAMLNGGPARLADTAVARLMAAGVLVADKGGRFRRTDRSAALLASPVDRAMVALPTTAQWHQLCKVAKAGAAGVHRQLQRDGLMIDDDVLRQMRLVQALPFVALLMLGTARLLRGIMLDHAVGYLMVLMIVTVVIGVSRLSVDRRTRAGMAVVGEARDACHRLRLAPTQQEMALAVALFGTGVLAGSAYEALHRLRAGGSDGGGSTSSDGSGCGSGGCGGCGG